MCKDRDSRVMILGCSLLGLIVWHIVITIDVSFFIEASPAQKNRLESITTSLVASEGQYLLDPEDPHNAPFNYSKLQINSASAELLETIPGIGPALANRIVEFRSKNGDIANFNKLIQVSGVGHGKIKILKQYTRL